MNHQQALDMRHEADQHDTHPACIGELEYTTAGFWDDVSWTVYRCQGCQQLIAAVGGGRHWWNYVLSEESTKRLFPYGVGDGGSRRTQRDARDQVIAVAPWGDTYTAEDIENGRMPLEARYLGQDDAAEWQDEETMIAAHIAQQELEEAARLDALDAEREARYSAGDWGDPSDYY